MIASVIPRMLPDLHCQLMLFSNQMTEGLLNRNKNNKKPEDSVKKIYSIIFWSWLEYVVVDMIL
jgi:hypothetical protein